MHVTFYLADQHPRRDRTLGITVYTDALLRMFAASSVVQMSALCSPSSFTPASPIDVRLLPFKTDSTFGRLVADQLHPLLSQGASDLWHYPKGFLPLLMKPSGPVVATVADVILQHYADHYPLERIRIEYQYWLAMLRRSISRCDVVVTISEFSRNAIEVFCDRYRLRTPPIFVTPLGADWSSYNQVRPTKRDTIVHLASTQAHKRSRTVIDFWELFEKQGGDVPQLELIGELSPADAAAARNLKSVKMIGRLPRPELAQHVARSRALLIASEIEGFGLPSLESYAVGTPVLYVRNTAVEEVLDRSTPGGFDLASYDSFQLALNEVLGMDAEACAAKRNELMDRFTWEKCAARTLTAYESALA